MLNRKPHPHFLVLAGLIALLAFAGTAKAQHGTFVPNSYFEEFKLPPVLGGPVATYLHSWQGSPDAVIANKPSFASPPCLGIWKVVLRGGSPGLGGDWSPDYAISDWIRVTPGKKYRLSGYLFRGDAADNVYLDFNDGRGWGGSFQDGQAMAQLVNRWELRAADVQVGPWTIAVQVRCVRDGANKGNAYCDGLMIEPLD